MEETFSILWLSGVFGFFLPLLISLVKRSNWSTVTKRALALGVSALAGVLAVAVEMGLNWSDPQLLTTLVASVVEIYVVASVTYANFWEDTAIESALSDVGNVA